MFEPNCTCWVTGAPSKKQLTGLKWESTDDDRQSEPLTSTMQKCAKITLSMITRKILAVCVCVQENHKTTAGLCLCLFARQLVCILMSLKLTKETLMLASPDRDELVREAVCECVCVCKNAGVVCVFTSHAAQHSIILIGMDASAPTLALMGHVGQLCWYVRFCLIH